MTRARKPTASVWEIRALARAIGMMGGDSERYLAALCVDPELLADLEARVPHETAVAAWELAPRYAQDEALALHLAEAWQMGAYDVLEYCVRASATFGASIEKLIRYQTIIHDASAISLTVDGEVARLRRRLLDQYEPAPPQVSEFVFAQLVVGGRAVTGVDWLPHEVCFVHRRPSTVGEYERIFRAPLRFQSAVDEVVFPRSVLDLPTRDGNPGLGAVLERQVQALLAQTPATTDFRAEVRKHLLQRMRGGLPAVADLAREIGVSARTFHRRLREEQSSFQAVVDEVRRTLALRHVESESLPLGELAFVLGFSDTSTFHRAFKRWTGMTPLQFRAARVAQPAKSLS